MSSLPDTHCYRRLYYLGYVAYGISLILAAYFYRERAAFADIAYHIFEITSKDNYAIQNHRIGAVFTQTFPLVASKLGLSLNSIMLLYSLGFVVLYTLCYWICGSVLKQYRWALLLLLINTLIVSHTFYWIQSEFPQALALMCVFFALHTAFPKQYWSIVVQLFLGCIIAFTHPIIPVAFYFVLAFLWLGKELSLKRVLIIGGVFGVIYCIKTLGFQTRYDHGSMGTIKNFVRFFPDYINLESNYRFLRLCLTHYYWIPISFVLIVAWYARKGATLKLLLCASAFICYLLLIQVCYPNVDTATPDCYPENLYLPLAVILGMPLVWDIGSQIRSMNMVKYAMVLVVCTYAARPFYTGFAYKNRQRLLTSFINQHRNEKLIAHTRLAGMEKEPIMWASPYEIWLLSTSRDNKTASIMITDSVDKYSWVTREGDVFVTTWGYSKYKDLPNRYFLFSDSSSTYKLLR